MEKEFGMRLKGLRLEHELTMDYVVQDMKQKFNIEINKGQLSRWENGKSITMRYIKYLAMYYNVSADYLLGMTNSKKPSMRVTALREEYLENVSDLGEEIDANVNEVHNMIEDAIANADKHRLSHSINPISSQIKQTKQA